MNFKYEKNLGFGCMRLDMKDGEVDYDNFCKMIDKFIDAGFTYFDTAHGYIDGKSEQAIRKCLTERYPRDAYMLANKLSNPYFETEEEIIPFFENQLKICGVEYFDFYLFHAMSRNSYEKYKKCNAFDIVYNLKKEGRIKHIAMSFHDTADVLDTILTENPFIEFVQLQLNYLDYDDPGVQSKKCYDVAVAHGKKVIVMEPVKGGGLVNLPDDAKALLDKLCPSKSYASYALRYVASYPEVFMVLSGMGNEDMMNDNINTFTNFEPLSPEEQKAASELRKIIRTNRQIHCTGCEYCLAQCPKGIKIPLVFSAYNTYLLAKATRSDAAKLLPDGAKATECIGCGMCEAECPQRLEIRKLLAEISKRLGIS